jgi:hypothetical protein
MEYVTFSRYTYIYIPATSVLAGTNTRIPYFLIADEAFPLKEHIMRAYPGKNLSRKEKKNNYRLSRARQVIENTFGVMVARWRILKTDINAKVSNVDNIVKAIVVLDNYCQSEFSDADYNRYCPSGYVDVDDEENGAWRDEQTPLPSVRRLGANVARTNVYQMRDALANYFISDHGNVAWQDEMINRGRI